MKRLLLFTAVFLLGLTAHAQSDSTCSSVMKLYTTLDSKDKIERNKYKGSTAETRQGTLGKISFYKSTFSIPGFSDPTFSEGGGSARAFSTVQAAATYEDAVKQWNELDKKLHGCFTSSWTFTESNEPRELYKSVKITRDGSLLTNSVRYYIERTATAFRVVLEIVY